MLFFFILFIFQHAPWVIKTADGKLDGFMVDLLDEISKISAFEYVMKPSNDETYGSIHHGTGEWNGIIGDLLNGVVII